MYAKSDPHIHDIPSLNAALWVEARSDTHGRQHTCVFKALTVKLCRQVNMVTHMYMKYLLQEDILEE